MGRLVDGQWRQDWYESDDAGQFHRPPTRFRDRVEDRPGARFTPEAGRYHLHVSYACPWAHRTLVGRQVLGLQDAISVSVVDPKMGDEGWVYPDGRKLQDVYRAAKADYTGRVTVPVLWDRTEETIVNNESREILRMLDTAFAGLAEAPVTLLPEGLEETVDGILDAIYEPINNGVYRTGFATSQAAYETACGELFDALDHWEEVLAGQRYLAGEVLTEADVCMYTTLVRFNLVYHGHFKCNVRRIQDYPQLWGYLKDLHQTPGFAEVTNLEHIKTHYYWSQPTVNPTRIVPVGPTVPLDAPHDRDRLGPRKLAPRR